MGLFLSYQQEVAEGVLSYALEHDGWDIYTKEGIPDIDESDLTNWDGDGIILGRCGPEQQALLIERGTSIVGIYVETAPKSFPVVCSDHEVIGSIAAKHLLRNGLRTFAYMGDADLRYSVLRLKGFSNALHYAGHSCTAHLFEPNASPSDFSDDVSSTCAFLQSLKQPTGVLVDTDRRAAWILNLCKLAKLRVPNDIALVSVDNQELLCRTSRPTLSSIAQDGRRIGYHAAELLDKLMNGEDVQSDMHTIPPLGVVPRVSSFPSFTADRDVQYAIEFIRNRFSDHIDAADVARTSRLSRRALDNRFKKERGCTISIEIRRARINQAKELMKYQGLILSDIAIRCGYKNLQRFHEAFRRETGMTPGAFLRLNRSV